MLYSLAHSSFDSKTLTKIMVLISSGDCKYPPPFPKMSCILFQSWVYFLLLVVMIVVPPATSLSFNISSFNGSESQRIITQGDATVSGPLIDLTSNKRERDPTDSVGGVFYNTPVQLWDKKTGNQTNFTSHFSFTFGDAGTSCETCFGDGLAFFIAPSRSVINTKYAGGGLGLFNSTPDASTTTLPNSNYSIIAVEFDTHQDPWDPDSSHIGIDISSAASVRQISCDSFLWNWMRTHGEPWEAWVSYDSSSHNLSVGLTCVNKSLSNYTVCSLHHTIDLREYLPENVTVGFSASTGAAAEVHQLNYWDFNPSVDIIEASNYTRPPVTDGGSDVTVGFPPPVIVVIAVGGGVTVIAIVLGLILFIRRRKKQESKADDDDDVILDVPMGPREFTFAELAQATRDFDEEQKLGEGGFGGVYRGSLSDIHKEVAVKKISKGSKQGTKEYASEVKIISRLRHRNLVQLIGWCHQKKELLLAYEFLPNGSLDTHLFRNKGSLTWGLRYKIALDLASTIQYLHEGWEQCILHRDIKSSNVILDTNFNAKLGDFGLARLVKHEEEYMQASVNVNGTAGDCITTTQTQTTNIVGTRGYMAPEYILNGKATKESDIYSFGIVLLEIVCGRRPIEIMADPGEVNLVNWVWELYGTQRHLETADPSQGTDFDKRQVECLMIVGLWCAHPDYKLRPSIGKAINVLQFDAALPILPSKMPIFTNLSSPS